MRDELRTLRAEVELLRAAVEQQRHTTLANDHGELVPEATTGAGPNVPSLRASVAEGVGKAEPVAAASSPPQGTGGLQRWLALNPSTSSDAALVKKEKIAPFSDWDWTWLNGNPRNKDTAFDSQFFTPEIRADITYSYDFNKPIDNSIGGSSEIFRSNEIQLEQLGLGGDFHYDKVRARFMTQFGMYSATTPRNDPSPAKGQWDLDTADSYIAEAYGGYHINALNGINIDAGIFLSYIGLFSY